LSQAFSEARRFRQGLTLPNVLVRANWIKSITRSTEMQQDTEELLALSTEHGFPLYLGFGLVYRGLWLNALGQAQEGFTRLKQGLAAIRATGAVVGTSFALTGLAEAYAMLGQPVEGLNSLAEAAQIVETTDERYQEADLHRVRGELLNAIRDRAAAEHSYGQALAIAARQGAKTFELGAATSLACLWRDQGKRTEARDLLAPIYGWFTEGFDTPVLQDAKALLDQLT
jgi:predicted ATPase